MKMSIYADGASTGRVGPIGWAWILVDHDRNMVVSGIGSEENSTNNVAEIKGIRDGLQALIRYLEHLNDKDVALTIVSDSQYAIGVCSGKFNAKSNQELVAEVRELFPKLRPFNVTTSWLWIPGHSNTDPWHDRADSLAVHAKKQLQGAIKGGR